MLKIFAETGKISGFLFLPFVGAYINAVFILGDEENGSLNWIKIKGIGFQPSEIVKFLFLLYSVCFQKPLDF